MEWTRYKSDQGEQFTNSDGVNIQSYGGDTRYSDFQKKVKSGEYTVVDFVAPITDESLLKRKVIISEIEQIERSLMRPAYALLMKENTIDREFFNSRMLKIETLRKKL